MNTPVTHGSGTMVVTGTGAGHRARARSRRCSRPTAKEKTPLTAELEQAHAVDRGRGRAHDDRDVRARPLPRRGVGRAVRQRRRPGDRRRPRGAAHGDADDPVARRGGPGQAQRHREGAAVGRDARLHVGDQLRQDRHPDDEPDDGRRGGRSRRPLHRLRHRLRPRGAGPPRRRDVRRPSRPRSCPTSWPATPSSSTARSWATPPRARCWCSATRPASTSTPPASGCPGWPRCRSTRPTSSWRRSTPTTDADGRPVVRCFVKGAAPAVMARAATALSAGGSHPVGRRARRSGPNEHMERMERAGLPGDGRGACATSTRPRSTRTATCSATSPTCR